MIKAETAPANPSMTAQLKPMFTFAALGFVDVVGEVELPVPDVVGLPEPEVEEVGGQGVLSYG
jgi:hypothetical protein